MFSKSLNLFFALIKPLRPFLILLLLFSLCACFPKPDPRWNQIESATKVSPQIKERTCQLLNARTNEISSLRALSEIVINSDSGVQSMRLSSVFSAPSKVRFEILPPAAAVALFIASSNENETLLLEPAKKQATKVQDPQDLIARLLKVRIMPQDLVYILSGRIPPRHLAKICEQSGTNEVEFFNSTDGPGVTIFDYQTGQYWTVSMGTGLLRTALIRRVTDDWPVIAADFEEDDFSDLKQLYPRRANLVLGNEALFARIEPSIVKFNTVIPSTLFELKIPGGYLVEEK
jgi:outer membrane lipoprotein-sorting protein